MAEYEAVIGMEVHVELQTRSKMFCSCEVAFGGEPNTRCCPVCLGLPGSLPVVNERAVELMARAALALNCTIAQQCIFHRKNYYYPDLPKNYQISQYDYPLGVNGWIEILAGGRTKRIAIRRVHMEEDTGKLVHVAGNRSLVDYNRSGVPLMEIVTQNPPPEGLDQIESAEEAREYLQRLRQILLYLGVSDVKMEEGSMRCEPNVSVRPKGRIEFGVKTEIKNLNSFRAVYLGVDYEIKRQIKLLEQGGAVVQETRRWDDERGVTVPMRSKEYEQEYRYFPDPDLVPLRFTKEWIEKLRTELPELPLTKLKRFMSDYGLSQQDAEVLIDSPELAEFYDACATRYRDPRVVANWLVTELLRLMNAKGKSLGDTQLTAEHVCELLELVDAGTINRNTAKAVFEEMFDTGRNAVEIVRAKGLEQVSDELAIESVVNSVLETNPKEVERFRAGEQKLLSWFVGQVMRETKGKANPATVNRLLREKLGG
ncbi:MAG: Asp-tRNA(Asn)/Glu-tRNA(Gln) amidotransferase subunit GatB [Armatimonadota bacterium]